MRPFFSITTLFLSMVANGQLYVSGKITSEGKPVPFANLQISGTLQGGVANSEGFFTLTHHESFDTLIVSHIGYYPQKVLVKPNSSESILVVLKEHVFSLESVTITSQKLIKNANQIVKKAIHFIKKRKPTASFAYIGHYRHSDVQDDEYRRLIDASIQISQNAGGNGHTSILARRASKDLRVIYVNEQLLTEQKLEEWDAKYQNDYSLDCWFNKHNYQYKSGTFLTGEQLNICQEYGNARLTNQFYQQHRFKLDSITYFNENLVYQIKILPTISSPAYYQYPSSLVVPVGKLFIRASDFALLSIEYNYILNPRKRGSQDFRLMKQTLGSGIITQYRADYKVLNNHIYLSYLSTKDYLPSTIEERALRGIDGQRVYNLVHREFAVNDIITDSIVEPNTTSVCSDDILTPCENSDDDFWRSFNSIPETEEMRGWRVHVGTAN